MTRILIVEDEESYSEPLAYMLKKEGYDAVVAATGPEGIEIGTPLSTLRETFTTDAWDAADVFEGSFEIFAGDTTGAAFRLDADERVDRMSAGYTCGLGR